MSNIPYNVSVGAVNGAGDGQRAFVTVVIDTVGKLCRHALTLYTFMAGNVSALPLNVTPQRSSNGRMVFISWDPLSLEEVGNFFAYQIIVQRASLVYSQTDVRTITVPFNETSVNITDLKSNRDYTITVNVIINSEGTIIQGPTSSPIQVDGIR